MNRFACTLLLASTLALGGCASMSDFAIDPSEWFAGDWFGNKKKLDGERRPVFPEGVPGVSRGVPSELVKGYQQQPGAGQDVPLVQAIAEEPKPKAKPKPKPKPQVAAKPARPPEPESRPTPITVRRSDAPTGQQQPAGGQQQPAADQWPDPAPPRQQPPAPTAWPDPARPGGRSGGVQWPDPPPTR
jgi:hypothetical protein